MTTSSSTRCDSGVITGSSLSYNSSDDCLLASVSRHRIVGLILPLVERVAVVLSFRRICLGIEKVKDHGLHCLLHM